MRKRSWRQGNAAVRSWRLGHARQHRVGISMAPSEYQSQTQTLSRIHRNSVYPAPERGSSNHIAIDFDPQVRREHQEKWARIWFKKFAEFHGKRGQRMWDERHQARP